MLRLSLHARATLVPIVAVLSCGRPSTGSPPVLKLLSRTRTGVTFANTITTTDSVNVLTDVFLYNGAGVAVGDIDNDGLPDIFFAGNMVSSRLYLNKGNMRFEDITQSAGVTTTRWATGVTMVDINDDGYLDIYVSVSGPPWSKPEDRANLLFINNGNHTFTEAAARDGIADTAFTSHAVTWLKHSSFAGMGVDIADFNNDGRPDILQVDMMPQALSERKRMSGFTTRRTVMDLQSQGFRIDYGVNSLQLNNGVTNQGDIVFSDVARLAGVAYTNWSWSALFGDFDNDGYKDILITNGYPKAVTDLDYQQAMFRASRTGEGGVSRRRQWEVLRQLRGYKASNYVFRNEGDLTFTDRTREWGMDQQSFSYGAAYADLNNDGKLDVVVNNIDAPAFIYENVQPRDDAHHYLEIALQGESPNRRGIGASLVLTAGGQKQYLYHSPYRGYMSTMDDREHVGLGRATRVDSLEVTWPDGRHQVLTDLAVDRMVTLRQGDASPTSPTSPNLLQRVQPMDPPRALDYRHQTGSSTDYSVQPLL